MNFEYLADEGMISHEDVNLVKVVDTAEEGWDHIRTFWKTHRGGHPAE